MLSNDPHQSSLRPLGGRHIFERLQKEIQRKVKMSTSGIPEIKALPPRQAQEFLNYLGCRLRTSAMKFHTTQFASEGARSTFEEKINTEFDIALELMAILVCSGKHFACPKYMTDCIDIETDGLYRIGTDFDQDDGITVILKDNDDDWWVNGTDPPPDVHSLLRAWRHFQSFSKPALFDLETASEETIDRQYELVTLTKQALHATYVRYKAQMVELQKEIRELEIALPEAEAQELELLKARLR